MFLWQTSVGMKIFRLTPQVAFETSVLAKNQGLYNGFLASGLVWSFFVQNGQFAEMIQIYFLSCVIIAGVYGALTARPTIFFVQAVPAIIALITILIK